MLEKLSQETGGRYYAPEDAKKLGNDINYSEAGITVRETRDLWDMPVVFLALLLLRSSEWLLRRKWGDTEMAYHERGGNVNQNEILPGIDVV